MNINKNSEHSRFCNLIVGALSNAGVSTKREVYLPGGLGSIDIVTNHIPPWYIEAKSHPVSPKDPGVVRQFTKYKKYFPGGVYILACPTHDGRTLFHNLSNGNTQISI